MLLWDNKRLLYCTQLNPNTTSNFFSSPIVLHEKRVSFEVIQIGLIVLNKELKSDIQD